jgi:hypothetical protein
MRDIDMKRVLILMTLVLGTFVSQAHADEPSEAIQKVVITGKRVPDRVVSRATIMSATCGPHAIGLKELDNGIGQVDLTYKVGEKLMTEQHLVADPALCSGNPNVVKLALDGMMGSRPVLEVAISNKGIKAIRVVDRRNGEKILEGAGREVRKSFMEEENASNANAAD